MPLQTDKRYDEAKDAILQRGYNDVRQMFTDEFGSEKGSEMLRAMFTFTAKFDGAAKKGGRMRPVKGKVVARAKAKAKAKAKA